MEKVIYNLLTNAFKFTPNEGHIRLHAETKNNEVQIHVIDNVRGIAPQFSDKLFNSYFQADDTNSQNTGYGIGLALSKTLVEFHKGALTAESHPATADQKRITRFTVTLQKGKEHFKETDWLQEGSDTEKHITPKEK